MSRILIIDFEVFRFDWLIGYAYYEPKKPQMTSDMFEYIINDRDALMTLYEANKASVWVGHNVDKYDDKILKMIIDNKEHELYEKGQTLMKSNWVRGTGLVTFDTLHQPVFNNGIWKSLKYLSLIKGYSGYECDVPFDLKRKLNDDEVEDVLDYNFEDVQLTYEIFNHFYNGTFRSKVEFCKEFKVPLQEIKKSWAMMIQSTVEHKPLQDGENDKDVYYIDDDRLRMGKYQHILDRIPRDKAIKLSTFPPFDVNGIPHQFGEGGIHGTRKHYSAKDDDGRQVWFADVRQYYQAIQISSKTQSRKIKDENFIRKTAEMRQKLKKAKSMREKSYKAILVIIYGISRWVNSKLYDPLMGYNTCLYGQLYLIDLIDKLEDADPSFKLVQSNTDGIAFHTDDIEYIKEVTKEWESRLEMEMEYTLYDELFQKDVNNYVAIEPNGNTKTKGAVVNKYIINDMNFHDYTSRWQSIGVVDGIKYIAGTTDEDYDLRKLSAHDMQIVKTCSDDKGRAKNKTVTFGIKTHKGKTIDVGRHVRIYFVKNKTSKLGPVGQLISIKADESEVMTAISGINAKLRKTRNVNMLVYNKEVKDVDCTTLLNELDYELYEYIVDNWIQEFGGQYEE